MTSTMLFVLVPATDNPSSPLHPSPMYMSFFKYFHSVDPEQGVCFEAQNTARTFYLSIGMIIVSIATTIALPHRNVAILDSHCE